MANGLWLPSTNRMAMGESYSKYQDIINGIASGKVNSQNYEELLNGLGIKDPVMYDLAKRHIEEALKYSARNLNALQANAMYSLIADAPNASRGLDTIVKDIQDTQAAKQRVVSPTGFVMPADTVSENAPQVVPSPGNNIIDPASVSTGYDFGIPVYSPPNTSDIYKAITPDSGNLQSKQAAVNTPNVPDDASKIYAGLAQVADELFFKKARASSSTSTVPAKTPKKQKDLQNLTKSINIARTPVQIARPDYTNIAYGSQAHPMAQVQPEEPLIDESYYRYLRNNGFNDSLARQQAIRYY